MRKQIEILPILLALLMMVSLISCQDPHAGGSEENRQSESDRQSQQSESAQTEAQTTGEPEPIDFYALKPNIVTRAVLEAPRVSLYASIFNNTKQEWMYVETLYRDGNVLMTETFEDGISENPVVSYRDYAEGKQYVPQGSRFVITDCDNTWEGDAKALLQTGMAPLFFEEGLEFESVPRAGHGKNVYAVTEAGISRLKAEHGIQGELEVYLSQHYRYESHYTVVVEIRNDPTYGSVQTHIAMDFDRYLVGIPDAPITEEPEQTGPTRPSFQMWPSSYFSMDFYQSIRAEITVEYDGETVLRAERDQNRVRVTTYENGKSEVVYYDTLEAYRYVKKNGKWTMEHVGYDDYGFEEIMTWRDVIETIVNDAAYKMLIVYDSNYTFDPSRDVLVLSGSELQISELSEAICYGSQPECSYTFEGTVKESGVKVVCRADADAQVSVDFPSV